MRSVFFLVLFALTMSAFGQFGAGGGEGPMPFDSSDIIADRIVKSSVPVVLDFWAAWCKPCRMLAPIIEDLKKKYAGRIKVIKIDIEAHRRIAAYFRIQSIPAVYIIKDKAVVQYLPGLQDKSAYEQAVASVLKPEPARPKLPKDSTAQPPAKTQQ
jgi:thioredoxin 1